MSESSHIDNKIFFPAKTLIFSNKKLSFCLDKVFVGSKVSDFMVNRFNCRGIKYELDSNSRLLNSNREIFLACLHPVWAHCTDVALSMKVLFNRYLSEKHRLEICEKLEASVDEVENLFVFSGAMHDIGKCSPHFLSKMRYVWRGLSGFDLFPKEFMVSEDVVESSPAEHGEISVYYYDSFIKNEFNINTDLVRYIGGHHGFPVKEIGSSRERDWRKAFDSDEMVRFYEKEAKSEWIKIKNALNIKEIKITKKNQKKAFIDISGLLVLADWIGSDPKIYGHNQCLFDSDDSDRINYVNKTEENIIGKIDHIKYDFRKKKIFGNIEKDIFGEHRDFSELQNILKDNDSDYIVVGSGTGDGKTAGAMSWVRNKMKKEDYDGFVFLMPTRATANALVDQIKPFCINVMGVNPSISHSGLIKPEYVEETYSGENMEDFIEWNNHSKNAFFGKAVIATIDQALVSAMPVRHFFSKLFCHLNKVVVIDEIHSYDSYTFEIILKYIKILKKMGIPILVMTATISNNYRKRILQSMGFDSVDNPSKYPYVFSGRKNGKHEYSYFSPRKKKRTIRFEKVYMDKGTIYSDIAKKAIEAAKRGANVAIICNTVLFSQKLYQFIEMFMKDNMIAFHSRFFQNDRMDIERKILLKFGPDSKDRPAGSITIATQVIEQSIDLDFDYMITEICPIDALMQRAGRLHRHCNVRPIGFKKPKMLIVCKRDDEKKEERSYSDTAPYDYHLIIATECFLDKINGELKEPSHFCEGVNFVYDDPEIIGDYKALYDEGKGASEGRNERDIKDAQMSSFDSLEPIPSSIDMSFNGPRKINNINFCFKDKDGNYVRGNGLKESFDKSMSSISIANKGGTIVNNLEFPKSLGDNKWGWNREWKKLKFQYSQKTGMIVSYEK